MTTHPPQRGNSPLGFPDFKTGLAITQAFMGLFSQTIEVFFRRDFGERYFSLFGIYGTVATYAVFFLAISLIPGKQATAFFRVFLFASLIMFVMHQVAIWQRNQKGIRWHSRYHGTSRLAVWLLMSGHIS